MNIRRDALITFNEFIKALGEMMNDGPDNNILRVYTSGSGVPDYLAIKLYRDSNIVVVTRDGTEYLKGEKRG